MAASYQHCRNLARTAARNFYYGFALLPNAKRDALCALYAFMRCADDISDSNAAVTDKKEGLKAWRNTLDRALAGEFGTNPILPAFHDTMRRFNIPPAYLHDLMRGAEMDLEIDRYPTFEQLREYCYCVAGTVGLCCVHVFGFKDPSALELAPKLGIAFQLTNILRDVREDYAMGRVYLPQDDLVRFNCSESDIARNEGSDAFIRLMRFEADRAWDFYREGVRLQKLVEKDSQAALWVLIRIYSGILKKIESIQYDVLAKPRPSLSNIEKAWIMIRGKFL